MYRCPPLPSPIMRRRAEMLTFRLLSSTCVFGQTRSINSFLPMSFPGRSTSAISVSSARLPRRSGLSPSSSMRWRGKSRKEPKTIAFSVLDNLPTLAQIILRRDEGHERHALRRASISLCAIQGGLNTIQELALIERLGQIADDPGLKCAGTNVLARIGRYQ